MKLVGGIWCFGVKTVMFLCKKCCFGVKNVVFLLKL